MSYNLKNRSFLKLLDFSKRDMDYILDLSRELKRAKYGGYEVQKLRGSPPFLLTISILLLLLLLFFFFFFFLHSMFDLLFIAQWWREVSCRESFSPEEKLV